MADLSITAANVLAGSNAKIEDGIAAVAVTAGQTGYLNSSGNIGLADNDAASPANAVKGLILNGAAAGQPCKIQTDGDITIGATLALGAAYYASDTAGGICPFADLTTGQGVSLIGVAKSTTVLSMAIRNTGAAIA